MAPDGGEREVGAAADEDGHAASRCASAPGSSGVPGSGLTRTTLSAPAAASAARLARWASALLAVASVLTVSLAVLPDAFYRLLAYPNSIAMIGLGYSLWCTTRTDSGAVPTTADRARLAEAGAE